MEQLLISTYHTHAYTGQQLNLLPVRVHAEVLLIGANWNHRPLFGLWMALWDHFSAVLDSVLLFVFVSKENSCPFKPPLFAPHYLQS